ncbi:serine/threonine-protein kinase [Streptomyces albireticuli]|uniref:serine/threonine-protein kinase n=1 Tax=Streptomyces albireticuli TaxID=1940 RepID=UPI001E28B559|nr:serine/threonine-protein kinase [Streptomyces albireticuli]MCD9141718.1 serine/threonine protein kinase [Streptomyces albireticuli]MCD9165918.1 serine/threonine protein kinase [Streptomyces albireticuli]MCD9189892.1 serine/threonine protein kinase [Streptomyces albireticuli]
MGNSSDEVRGQRLVVGRYRLLELIGRGGMGRVWRADDRILGRLVAAKEIRIDGLVGEASAVQRERSLREARATARIDHPNVVRVYDVAEEDDRLWIVMELVDGRSLEQALGHDGPVTPREAARIGLGLVRALRAVHAVGVLHRDIKPGNVLLTAGGRIVLTDFGIAAMQDAAALTMAGTLVGSPEYMAPERIEGRQQGPPSDLWSLGATLCAAVAGRSPFTRATTLATLHAVLYEQPEIPAAAGPLRELLAGLLLKEAGRRPSLDAVEAALAALAEPVPHPPTVLAERPPPVVPAPPPDPAPVPPPEAPARGTPGGGPPRRRAALLAAGAVVTVSAVAVGIVLVARGPGGGEGGDTTAGGTDRPPASSAPADPATGREETGEKGSGGKGTGGAARGERRTEDGFSWEPPADWNRTQQTPSDVTYTSKDGAIELSAKQGRTTEDLLTHWERFEQGFHGTPGYRKRKLEKTTFSGDPAVVWEYAFLQGGKPRQGRQLGFEKGGRTYQVSVWYADSAESTALAVYERAKKSFETS